MKQRNPIVVIVLSLITFGVYYLYWLYITRKELVAKGHNIPPLWWIFAPLLALILVAVLQIIVRFALGTGSDGDGISTAVNVISLLVGMVAVLAIFPVSVYWMWLYSKAVETVTNQQISSGLAFGLWVVLALVSLIFIWPGIIQEYFNKVSAAADPAA